MTYNRSRVIDYSYPYELGSLIFSSPTPTITHFHDLLQPFDTCIWISIIITITLIILILSLINNNRNKIVNLCWDVLVVYLRQNGCKSLMNAKNKPFIFTWLLMTIILDACYLGCIYSLMSIPIEYKIETLNELVKNQMSGNIKIIVGNGSVHHHVLVGFI